MIAHNENHGYSDVGISLESATGAEVYNNTIFHEHDYPNAIEYRFAASNNLTIINNLSNRAIVSRSGGTVSLLANNITSAATDWFTNVTTGDLHLVSELNGVAGSALDISGLSNDFDLQSRPLGTGSDIGADEYSANVPDKFPVFNSISHLIAGLLLLL
ncbi:MAG: hypothetical protein KZQ64_11950 [gamma proteobacterium symbiont of Bathyaustriella thionipta]|nr:hypothetical protein [gamma proteobacterium symbiont of Bathyaustriella thionipta]MCU7949844.1 hypothetical protein [gamma proteobacterium symbiont of Bathyaustriella thionipta]MCU7954084.1 hypothetical protein [gamma proteobacterium symbiont of Bathyaustriella thionipta]MCU7956418.1 hypothetical protein [gamma proteobacterium symbiont of Bathyaustriella thionipta]MCU7966709.1 hypothetical protein [gamma proteobacterium symbiont of Bathyaustriella thionipta]